MVLVHGYLAGGFGANKGCITKPEDVKGVQIRAAGKAFEQMLADAGASISSMASSEIYPALQTGVLDAANTSSESFVSYRLYEQLDCYTPAGDYALWFMYQPLLMNKTTFDGLTEEQQAALMEAGKKAEAFYLEQAKKGDEVAAEAFEDAGVEIGRDDRGGLQRLAGARQDIVLPGLRRGDPGRAGAARHGARGRVSATDARRTRRALSPSRRMSKSDTVDRTASRPDLPLVVRLIGHLSTDLRRDRGAHDPRRRCSSPAR